MSRRAHTILWKRAAITAVVAYALVLQAVLLAFSGASHAAVLADAPGIVCEQGRAAAPDQGSSHGHEALCCLLGCHAAGAGGPAPAAVGAAYPALAVPAPPVVAQEPVLLAASSLLPLGSRAPPRLG